MIERIESREAPRRASMRQIVVAVDPPANPRARR